jgi:hypothetical protein
MSTLEDECMLEIIDFLKYHLLRHALWPIPSGRTRKDLPEGKRIHFLGINREEIIANFRKLDQETKTKQRVYNGLRNEDDLDTPNSKKTYILVFQLRYKLTDILIDFFILCIISPLHELNHYH